MFRTLRFLQLPDPISMTTPTLEVESLQPLAKGTVVRMLGDDGQAAWVRVRRALVDSTNKEIFYEVEDLDVMLGDVRVSKCKARAVNPSPIEGLTVAAPLHYLVYGQNEQRCRFVASSGAQEEFFIHFPLNFNDMAENAAPGETVRWPLLFYLHGNGPGGSFLGISGKKGLKTPGLQYAAQNFIIVSPQCRWKWKSAAETWVLELAEELSKADWVDPARIYMTGCSMGGMSTWELASTKPTFFAAIAPIGAYHKVEKRSEIARSLGSAGGNMPIFAIHAKNDVTCPFPPEVELYKELVSQNARLRVDIHPSCGHPEIWRAYADSTEVWKWMLSYRNTWCDVDAYEARCARNVNPEWTTAASPL